MTTLTITRALAELKTIDKRISKLTNSITYVSYKVNGRRWDDHVQETKEKYQSLCDLISQYNKIKNAIIRSNTTTMVTIHGVEYSIAEAISHKNSIVYERNLLERMRVQRNEVRSQIAMHEKETQSKLDSLIEKSFSRDKKTSDSEIKTITDAFLKSNNVEEVDPLDINHKIDQLGDNIDNFMKEVDFVLSESNATTSIQI